MRSSILLAIALLLCRLNGADDTDDSGFRSIGEYKKSAPEYIAHIQQESIDDVFDTKNAAETLALTKRVRLFRASDESIEARLGYYELERKTPLKDRLGKDLPTIELSETVFRPILNLAGDFKNYGDEPACGNEPAVAIIIGNVEPDYILICCFKCHDIQVVRRPTEKHPMPQVARLGMSPELEKAIFDLAQSAFPKDEVLRTFKLPERKRATTPLKKDKAAKPASIDDLEK